MALTTLDIQPEIRPAGEAPEAATAADPALRRAFVAAIACFAVAAAAGSLMRFAAMHGLPYGWLHVNVRFAHTHLMYFGWATPALFALVGSVVSQRTQRTLPRAFHAALWASLAAGALSFVPFLLSGYQPTAVGDLRLPLSMIASTLAILAWTAWTASYVAATWQLRRDVALLAFDAAILTMLVATLGAWGLAAAAFSPVASGNLMDRLVHLYLGLFSNGWFGIAAVGLLLAPARTRIDERLGRLALLLLLGGTLAAALAEFAAGPAWLLAGARFAAAYGLIVLGLQLALAASRARDAAGGVLAALVIGKAAIEAALTVGAAVRWSQDALLPVFLAHGYLLGLVTLVVVWSALCRWRPERVRRFWLLAAATGLMLASMLPLTLVWPLGRGGWALPLAAWTSLAPTAAMLVIAVAVRHRPRGAAAAGPTTQGRSETTEA